jgi:hypothetical protein
MITEAEILELEAFFKDRTLPETEIVTNKIHIFNCRNFVDTHLQYLRTASGKLEQKIYLMRLREFMKYIIKNQH